MKMKLPLLSLLLIILSAIMKTIYSSSSSSLALLLFLLVPVICLLLVYFINNLWLTPNRIRWKLKRQGIKGPKPYFMYGNVPQMQKIQSAAIKAAATQNHGEFIAHDYTSTLFPYFELWRKQYGKPHLYLLYIYILHIYTCI